jgi:hypothetical protein
MTRLPSSYEVSPWRRGLKRIRRLTWPRNSLRYEGVPLAKGTKALKQNLTVKTFVGLKWLHLLSKANWSLSNLASMLRLNLFTYRDLTKWLADPMETPPLVLLRNHLLWRWCDLDRRQHCEPETST